MNALDRLPIPVFAGLLILATFAGVLLAAGLFTVLWTVGRAVAPM